MFNEFKVGDTVELTAEGRKNLNPTMLHGVILSIKRNEFPEREERKRDVFHVEFTYKNGHTSKLWVYGYWIKPVLTGFKIQPTDAFQDVDDAIAAAEKVAQITGQPYEVVRL